MRLFSKLKVYTLSLFVLICAFSCEDESDFKLVKMRVNHYVQPAMVYELSTGTTYFIQEGDDIGSDQWITRSIGMSGFDFELGYTYDLLVKVEKNDPGIMDAPSHKYTVVNQLAKTKVSAETTFELVLSTAYGIVKYVTMDETSGARTTNGINIQCESLCEELAEKLATETDVSGVFKHVNNNTIRLIELK